MKYTYDDLARHTGLKSVQGVTETDIVNNLTYGAAGELKSMSWSDTGGWATQNWTFNNRLQMMGYTYGGPGGTINHSYLFSTTANDGKLWRRQDNVSGEVVEYQYDSIHRLTSATTTAGTAWSQSFVYDGFGNMKQKIGTGLAVGTSFTCWKSIGGASSADSKARLAKTEIVAENQGRAIVRSDGAASWKVASTSDGVIYVNVSGGEFLQPENVAAAKQEDGSTVFINLLGYLERGVGLASGSLDADTFRAIYLLHELGHIMGGYANDKGDSNASMGFTRKVIDDCFSIPR